jgi:hypothetical protein
VFGHGDAAFLPARASRSVTADTDDSRLPTTLGGLVDFAFATYARYWRLYLLLALAALLVQAIVEFAIPARPLDTFAGEVKLEILNAVNIVVDAYIVCAVALGVGAKVTDQPGTERAIAATARNRWYAVFIIGWIGALVSGLLSNLSALAPGSLPEPRWVAIFTAPPAWLILGVIALAAPIAALSGERPGAALLAGLSRAIAFAAQRTNFGRLCVVAIATVLPALLGTVITDWLQAHHVARSFFWGGVTIDALTIGPVAAIQTAFALDFARRAGVLRPPR